MKKLKLNLDDIKVESFEVASNLSKNGTVFGEATALPGTDEENCTAVNCGGGENPTYETYCGTCPKDTCALTCMNTWCESCVQICYVNTYYNSCGCTHDNMDTICLASKLICAPPTCGFTTFPF